MKLFRLFLVLCLVSFGSIASAAHYTCNTSDDGFVDLRGLDPVGVGSPNVKNLVNGDTATVWVKTGANVVEYNYTFDVDGTNASNEPSVVRPTNYKGGGVWNLSGKSVNTLSTVGVANSLVLSRILAECEGAQDNGAAGSGLLLLTDTGLTVSVNEYAGMTLYNTTDASSCVVASNTAATWTCVGYVAGSVSGLTGGTDNDWDNGDAWAVAPGPLQSGTLFYITAATTILHPAIADYYAGYFAAAAVAVKIDPQAVGMTINFNDDGTIVDPGAGDEIDGDGTLGDYIFIHNQSATEAWSLDFNGSFADGGAS